MQIYSFYNKLFIKESKILKIIFTKLIFKKLKNYKKNQEQIHTNNNNFELNKKTINSNMIRKTLEDLPELKESIGKININKKDEKKNNIQNKKRKKRLKVLLIKIFQ